MLRRGARRGTRGLAAGAVVAVIWGWAVAQHPYILPPTLTVSAAAAPDATLKGLLAVFGIALLVVIPSFGLLFTLVQRSIVEETAAPDAVDVK
jgi:cytochrome bd ubiquinol oxidase subunit II